MQLISNYIISVSVKEICVCVCVYTQPYITQDTVENLKYYYSDFVQVLLCRTIKQHGGRVKDTHLLTKIYTVNSRNLRIRPVIFCVGVGHKDA
jgi:hypothetical protein